MNDLSQRFRRLDLEDLFILRHIKNGLTVAEIAKTLCVTSPAITARLRKIHWAFGCHDIFTGPTKARTVTGHGIALGNLAEQMLEIMEGYWAPR